MYTGDEEDSEYKLATWPKAVGAIFGTTQCVFLCLKLTNIITWDYVFVLMPSIVFGIIFLIAMMVAIICCLIISGKDNKDL